MHELIHQASFLMAEWKVASKPLHVIHQYFGRKHRTNYDKCWQRKTVHSPYDLQACAHGQRLASAGHSGQDHVKAEELHRKQTHIEHPLRGCRLIV